MRNLTVLLAAGTIGLFMAPAAIAGEANLQAIQQQCMTQRGYAPERCACVRAVAARQLNDRQQAFVAAQAIWDQAAVGAAQGDLTTSEMQTAVTFMATIADICP